MKRRARGVALLTALLVAALAAFLLAILLDQGGTMLARTRNVQRATQGRALADGLEDWSIQILRRDWASDSGSVDHAGDAWALGLPPTPVPGGTVHGSLRDLNGCLNLNALRHADGTPDTRWLARFQRLLEVLRLDPRIAQATADWLDGDAQPDGAGGAEDQVYAGAQPPYRAANRAFAHVGELRWVRGVTIEVWDRLQPHVCAVPAVGWTLNVNTASVPVLMALDPRIDESVARRLHQDGHAHYADLAAFNAALAEIGLAPLDGETVGVRSTYFLARAHVTLQDVPLVYSSVIQRRDGARTQVILRWRG